MPACSLRKRTAPGSWYRSALARSGDNGGEERSLERRSDCAVCPDSQPFLRHSGLRLPSDIPASRPNFPRLPDLCLYSLHPAADTPQGVAARRDRRGAWGKDAKPHAPGLRKVVSLRRHGGSGRMSDRSCRFTPRTARRMCLCGTQGGWTGGCVGIVRRDGKQSVGGDASVRCRQGARCRDAKRTSHPGNRRATSSAPAFAEGPKSQAKTAERGAEGCHYIFHSRQLSAPRPMLFYILTGGKSAAWTSPHAGH